MLVWYIRKVQVDYILYLRENLEEFAYMHTQFSEHIEEGTISFEEAQVQIVDFLTNQKKQQVISSYIEELRNKATIEDISL